MVSLCLRVSRPLSHSHSILFPLLFLVLLHLRSFLLFSHFTPPLLSFSVSYRKTSGTSSPDSVLKKSLLKASSIYPTTSSTTNSSSFQTDCTSFSTENHHWQKNLSSNYSRGHLSRAASSPISPAIELITRAPDGRFVLPPYDNETISVHSKKNRSYDRSASVPRSVSLYSDKKDPPFVLSVDFSPCQPAGPGSTSQICAMKHLPHHDSYILDQKAIYDGSPDLNSLCSNNSLTSIPRHDREQTPTFPVLPHIKHSRGQPSTTASNLVLQMEHERETGNLSRCLKLAQQREELERELLKYTLERGSMKEMKQEQQEFEMREDGDNDFMWEYKSSTLPHRYPQSTKKNFGLSPNHFSSSSFHWEAQPLVSPPTLIPARTHFSPSQFKSSSHHRAQSFTKQTPLRSEEAGSFSKDRLSLPHLSSMHQRHERVDTALEGYDNSPQSTVLEMQTNDSFSEAQRQNNRSHGSLSTLSFHSNKYTERSNLTLDAVPDFSKVEVMFSGPTDEEVCVEMSVDEPELEVCVMRPTKPMLHHRIASHVQQGHSLTGRSRYKDVRKSTSFNYCGPSVDGDIRIPAFQQPLEPVYLRTGTKHSKIWDSKQRSQSLDLRRRKERNFLTPDAWIDSLSQDTLFKEHQSSLPRKTFKAASHSPPAVDPISTRSSLNRSIPNPEVPSHYEPTNAAKWPIAYPQEGRKESEGYLEPAKAGWLPRNSSDLEALEVEAGGYDGVPESGSSYSSYASSGRGSMEPTNGRLSMCPLSPTLSCSPETVEENQGSKEDKHRHQMELCQRY